MVAFALPIFGKIGHEYDSILLEYVPTTRQASADAELRKISAAFIEQHTIVEKMAFRRLTRWFLALRADVLYRLDKADTAAVTVDEIFNPRMYRQQFNAMYRPQWAAAIYAGIQFESDVIGAGESQSTRHYETQDAAIPEPPPSFHVDLSVSMQRRIREYLRQREAGVWSKVGDTLHDRLRRALQKGLKEGDSHRDMKNRIADLLQGQADYASRRIARTETTGSMSFGQQGERDEIGIELKRWISTLDTRTRGANPGDNFNHLSADGQTVSNNATFTVSGQLLYFPGDGAHGASAGNLINCRCCASGTSRKRTGPTTPAPANPPKSKKPSVAPPKPAPDATLKPVPTPTMEKRVAGVSIEDYLKDHAGLNDLQQKVSLVGGEGKIKALHDEWEGHNHAMQKLNAEWELTKSALRRKGQIGTKLFHGLEQKYLDEASRIHKLREKAEAAADILSEEARYRAIPLIVVEPKSRPAFRVSVSHTKYIFTDRDGNKITTAGNASNVLIKKTADASEFIRAISSSESFGDVVEFELHQIASGTTRSFCSKVGKIGVFSTPPSKTAVYVHEIGHVLEKTKYKGAELTRQFRAYRVALAGTKDELMSVLTGINSYGNDEIGNEDSFRGVFGGRAGYVGKNYGKASDTELISMSVEMLYENPVLLAKMDPELFKFTIAFLRGML